MARLLLWSLGLAAVLSTAVIGGQSPRALSERVASFEPVYIDVTEHLASHERRRRDHDGASIPLSFQVTAYGRQFDLRLHKVDLGAGVLARVHSRGAESALGSADLPIYEGYVSGEDGSRVRGRIFDGIFEGVIHTREDTYHVEKADNFFRRDADRDFNAVVYRWSDVAFTLPDGTDICGKDIHEQMLQRQSRIGRELHDDASLFGDSPHHASRRAVSKITNEKNTCLVQLVSDHTFYAFMGGQSQTIAKMENVLHQVSGLYNETDFFTTDRGIRINVAPAGFQVYNDTSPDNKMTDTTTKIDETLAQFSQYDFDNVCLAHLFVHRDYGNGVLGLAWVGDASALGNAGGICQKRLVTREMGEVNLNTGVSTNVNFGSPVEEIVQIVTVAHEIGHNFGSPHDAPGPCAPGGDQGNYIMYPQSNSARLPNNKNFSPCSLTSMRTVMDAKASCFVAYPEAVCGNGRRENDEECDCGNNCGPQSCCTTDCKIVGQCSPLSSDCCTPQCTFANSSLSCRPAGMCTREAFCTGDSASCPKSEPLAETDVCDSGAYLCSTMGVCDQERSVCELYGAVSCTLPDAECQVSCIFDGVCQTTTAYSLINTSVKGANYSSTRSCNEYQGFCGDGVCKKADTHDTIDSITDFFSNANIARMANFIRENWYYFAAGAGTMVALLISLCCINHFELRAINRLQARRNLMRGHTVATGGTSMSQMSPVSANNSGKKSSGKKSSTRRELPAGRSESIPSGAVSI